MKKLPIGTRVFDFRFGWGEVVGHEASPFWVKFREGHVYKYTDEGKFSQRHKFPILSLTEYTLTEGGFTPITEFDKPKVGDIGYFWDNDVHNYVLYSTIVHIGRSGIYTAAAGSRWRHFSKEVPQWFIDRNK